MDVVCRVTRLGEAEEGERGCEVAGTRAFVVVGDRESDGVLATLRYPFELIKPCSGLKLQEKKAKQVSELRCMLTSNLKH